jgi:hypothetical protein
MVDMKFSGAANERCGITECAAVAVSQALSSLELSSGHFFYIGIVA